jgi:3-hydroxyacyl-[acyl-carrier-protein] dehydratase
VKPRGRELTLGSQMVELLIPYRRPFLMVDHVERFILEPAPFVQAGRHISMNEIYFQGHFVDMPLWPGALTLEGLGQTAAILLALSRLHEDATARGEDPEDVLEGLRNLDRGYRLHPGHRPEAVGDLLTRIAAGHETLAMGAAVDVKFLRPVFPGSRLVYAVELASNLGSRVRFSAEATVGGEVVAQGSLTAAMGVRPVAPHRL